MSWQFEQADWALCDHIAAQMLPQMQTIPNCRVSYGHSDHTLIAQALHNARLTATVAFYEGEATVSIHWSRKWRGRVETHYYSDPACFDAILEAVRVAMEPPGRRS